MFDVHADRWVRIRSGGQSEEHAPGADPSFGFDDSGFLLEPDSGSSGWCRPEEAAAWGGWVLLGEPGAGKSTEFRRLSGAHSDNEDPLPGESGTLWVDAGDWDSVHAVDARLGPHLGALPIKPGSGEASAEPVSLLIVLDQLDESACLHQLPQWLRSRLQGKDTRGLRIWVGCRAADYQDRLTGVLSHALGRCMVGDLAPLTRRAAAELVRSTGDDVDDFLHWVVSASAGALARVPLTLWVLLGAYREPSESIDATPLGLFTHGVEVLAAEHDPDRAHSWDDSTRQQRVAIASRVAAHLLFSARRSVHVDDNGLLTDVAVPLGQLVGADETAGLGTFEVTRRRVRETLETALFSRTRFTAQFAHSSFAAFLTARYLAERLHAPAPIPRLQLEELFLVTAADEPTAAIPERLRETAAWLLTHAPTKAMWLAHADPEGLLAHTALITHPGVREVLVNGLLDRADRIELFDRSWRHTRWDLAHPGLRTQLTEALTTVVDDTSDWPDVARARLALRLAHDSHSPDLADLLLDIVEDPAWPITLRRLAVSAAMAVDPAAVTITRLRATLATLQPPPDSQPPTPDWDGSQHEAPSELAAMLLRELWPAHLTFAEVSRFLRITASGAIKAHSPTRSSCYLAVFARRNFPPCWPGQNRSFESTESRSPSPASRTTTYMTTTCTA